MIILFGIITFFTTLSGGLFALRFRDKLHLILGFSAGAVVGVVFFDLLPQAISLGHTEYSFSRLASVAALGFIIYMVLDRLALLHAHAQENHAGNRGKIGAGSLSVHSFLDGIAIGVAFQISTSIGIIVAVGVMVHDFSDGVSTVSIILKNNGQRRDAFRWLLVDAITPLLGIAATFFFKLPEALFGLVLALLSGFFLYIGASDLLPESHHAHPTFGTTLMTILGMTIIYAAIKFSGM